MKRETHSDTDDDRPTSKGDQNTSGSSTTGSNKRFRSSSDEHIRILVPSKAAGALIGKGGQHINRLRAEYKCIINVEDCQGPERTLSIVGEFGNSMNVVDEMLKNFDEVDGEIDCRLLVHQSLAGCVIGKRGHKIKDIRDKVGCRVLKVFSNVCPQSSDRVIQCIGKQSTCMAALRDVFELIREVPIRGLVHNYDPINFDEIYADKYGGYSEVQNGSDYAHRGGDSGRFRDGGGSRFDRSRDEDRYGGRSRSGDVNRRQDNGNRGGDSRSTVRMATGSRGREFIDPWAPNAGPPMMGFGNAPVGGNGYGGYGGGDSYGSNSGNGGGYGGGGYSGGSNRNASSNDHRHSSDFRSGGGDNERNSTQVTIPKDLAGAIIGKAGQRIRQIRMESNAFITIDEPLPGSMDRIITITGTSKEIQLAQYLLQQSVLDFRQY